MRLGPENRMILQNQLAILEALSVLVWPTGSARTRMLDERAKATFKALKADAGMDEFGRTSGSGGGKSSEGDRFVTMTPPPPPFHVHATWPPADHPEYIRHVNAIPPGTLAPSYDEWKAAQAIPEHVPGKMHEQPPCPRLAQCTKGACECSCAAMGV